MDCVAKLGLTLTLRANIRLGEIYLFQQFDEDEEKDFVILESKSNL